MSRLEERDYTYFTSVRGMCRECRRIVPARVFFRDGKVWQQSICPTCESRPALIAGDVQWYLETAVAPRPDRSPLRGARPPSEGCPHDCGPCTWHATPCQLPVVSVTNSCNLNCPICFTYNRPDRLYYMSTDEMTAIVDSVVAAAGRTDLINVTGGEPTDHPEIVELLRCCQRPEIGRITMNSNGLRLAEDPDLCCQLAELGVYVILSFNTFDDEVSRRLHGAEVVDAKLQAIENLSKAGCCMTLLNVMIRDTNEDAIAGIFDLMRDNDSILSLTVQTMTHTGQGGGSWEERQHIPVDEAARIVCEQSGGFLRFSDFVTRPSAHPLCYLTSYMMKAGDVFLPFARFAESVDVQELMKDSYLLRLDDQRHFFQDAINRLYAEGREVELKQFRTLLDELYPADGSLSAFERQKISESVVRTVYIHSHMDEDTFDCSRAMLCPDQTPAEPGRFIPACTYNLFYRMQDKRFYCTEGS